MRKKNEKNFNTGGDTKQKHFNSLDMKQENYLLWITEKHIKFVDHLRIPYVSFERDGHNEVHAVKSQEYHAYLLKTLFEVYQINASKKVVKKIIGIVEIQALCSGVIKKLSLRVAMHDGYIWYDLCNSKYQAVRIGPKGWTVVDKPPIIFKRTPYVAEQVVPERGGKANALFRYTNIEKEWRLILLAAIISMFIPEISYPLIIISGNAGSGKSTLSRVISKIVSPSVMDILAFPENEMDFVQTLCKNHLTCFDNISKLSKAISDILCRNCTGGATPKRELYTDDQSKIYEPKSAVILNGIYQLGTEGDLVSRSLFFSTQNLSVRRSEKKFWDSFGLDKPKILGAIFDIVSSAMKNYQDFDTADRLGGFTTWGYAIANALNNRGENFLTQLEKMNRVRNTEAVIGHPLINAITIFTDKKIKWTGLASDLYKELCKVARQNHIDTRHASWPKAPNAMSRVLNALITNLEGVGILYESEGHKLNGTMLTLKRKKEIE